MTPETDQFIGQLGTYHSHFLVIKIISLTAIIFLIHQSEKTKHIRLFDEITRLTIGTDQSTVKSQIT